MKEYGISAEVIDIRSLQFIDFETIIKSVEQTGRVIVVDHADSNCGIAAEIIAGIVERSTIQLKCKPTRLTLPSYPCPTSPALSRDYYVTAKEIVLEVLSHFNLSSDFKPNSISEVLHHDQPNPLYRGPF